MSLAAALIGVVGCNEPAPPPAAYAGPTLTSTDLGIERVACAPTGYAILEPAPSVGRFPGAVAIARLVPAEQVESVYDDAPPTGWRLGTIPNEKATYWNALFNTISSIREVVVLDNPSLQTPDAGPADITAAAQLAKAGLCLIWGPREAELDHAALVGVVMDAQHGHPVAFLQADAGPEDFKPPARDHFGEDQSHQDVNELVARKFEQQVRDCVCELISRDQPIAETQPSPWLSATTRPGEIPPIPVYVIPNRPARW